MTRAPTDHLQTRIKLRAPPDLETVLQPSNEVEVVRWANLGGGEVWLNNGSIEGKVPASAMKKSNKKQKKTSETAIQQDQT